VPKQLCNLANPHNLLWFFHLQETSLSSNPQPEATPSTPFQAPQQRLTSTLSLKRMLSYKQKTQVTRAVEWDSSSKSSKSIRYRWRDWGRTTKRWQWDLETSRNKSLSWIVSYISLTRRRGPGSESNKGLKTRFTHSNKSTTKGNWDSSIKRRSGKTMNQRVATNRVLCLKWN
jgi:hypothetical protein